MMTQPATQRLKTQTSFDINYTTDIKINLNTRNNNQNKHETHTLRCTQQIAQQQKPQQNYKTCITPKQHSPEQDVVTALKTNRFPILRSYINKIDTENTHYHSPHAQNRKTVVVDMTC